MNVCVFGAASNLIDEIYVEKVELLGKTLAKNGHKLVFGAGGNGLMGAIARGFSAENATIYGIIPHFFKDENIEAIYENCTELTFTEDMAERKAKMENLADAFIIVPGGIGTFEEFFQVLTGKQLNRHTKPIAIYDISGYYKNMVELLEKSIEQKFIRENCKNIYFYSDDINEIIDYIENDERISHNVHELKNG